MNNKTKEKFISLIKNYRFAIEERAMWKRIVKTLNTKNITTDVEHPYWSSVKITDLTSSKKK